MQRLLAALCALAACGPAAGQEKQGPVEKVVHLLRSLKERVGADGDEEARVYDKYACWCEQVTGRKATAITTAQAELRGLGQEMLKLKGAIATLEAEIAALKQAIEQNLELQAQATALRAKEHEQFAAETAEMKQAIDALERAMLVLRQGTQSSFLQASGISAVRAALEALPASGRVGSRRAALLQTLAGAGTGAGYQPQSWTVQGILGDMYATFTADLEGATGLEARKSRDYELFIAEKTRELAVLRDEKAAKEQRKAKAEAALADTTQNYGDTERQMKADIAFFDESKAACAAKHAEWVARSQLRAEELQGISKALEILSTDAARELFASAIKPGKETGVDESYDPSGVTPLSLLQAAAGPGPRAQALLQASAKRAESPRLAALALRLRSAKVGHFDRVIAAIDRMTAELTAEDDADVRKRDQCISEYHKTKSATENLKWLIRNNEAAIRKLEREIAALTAEREQTLAEIADLEAQMREMEAQRKAENEAFLHAKHEDQEAIGLLSAASAALGAYYERNNVTLGPLQGAVKGLALAQGPEGPEGPEFQVSADQAPETEFSHKGHRKNEAKGILQLLTMLVQDLEDEIQNAMRAEELAQLDFERQMAAAQRLKAELVAKTVNLAAMIARRTQEKSDEHADLQDNEADLKDEQDYRARITPDCDWIIGAFEKRAARRAAEMDGLAKAKELLAGSQREGQ